MTQPLEPPRVEPGYDSRLMYDLAPQMHPSDRALLRASPLFQVALYGAQAAGWTDKRGWHRKQQRQPAG
jgi:hypothetical protein